MNILYAVHLYHPSIGGSEEYVRQCARKLIEKGHNVWVITSNKSFETKEKFIAPEMDGKIRVIRVPVMYNRFWPIPIISRRILREVFDFADIVHIHGIRFFLFYSLKLKRVKKIPVVIGSYGYIFHTNFLPIIKKIAFKYIFAPLLRKADILHTISIQDTKYATDHLKNSPKILEVSGGLDCERYEKIEPKPVAGQLFYWGRLSPHKNIESILPVVKKYPEYVLRLAYGAFEEDYLNDLKEKCSVLNISERVEFLGALSDKLINEELEKADFVVLASNYEGFGLTTVEAMSAGQIVVGNDIDAFQNLITNGSNGYLINYNNSEELLNFWESTFPLGNNERNNISKNARNSAKQYDWSSKAKDFEDCYESLVKK